MFSDDDVAALYDGMFPWNPDGSWERFYDTRVSAASSVLDVGCGTGRMLHAARERGHTGRLVGIDPDRAALARARRRADIEWVEGTAADAGRWRAEFELATMTGNAFQCLIGDDEVRGSLSAVRGALRPGGRFVFETRNPRARAWEAWSPDRVSEVVTGDGRALRMWHEVESVEGDVVTLTETTARADGTVLRVDSGRLRFLGAAELDAFLAEAGFDVRTWCGGHDGEPLTPASGQIVIVARRP